MNKRQKIVQEAFLDNEEAVIDLLDSTYTKALKDIEKKAKAFQKQIETLDVQYEILEDYLSDEEKDKLLSMKRSKVYQKQYQDSLKSQVSDILDKMHDEEFETVSEYLTQCYEEGFLGTMYDLHGQGIPLIFPIDQEAIVRAVQLDSKISKGLYKRLGEDVTLLKKNIASEISRGISTGASYSQIALQIKTKMTGIYDKKSGGALFRAETIAVTEGHRIQVQSGMDACYKAQENGADVLKQWDATLDGATRPSHRKVDGEIRELDEPFSNGLMHPGDPAGGAAEVIRCRCALLQRARWALDEDELKTLKKRADYFGLDKADSFEDFKKKYLGATRNYKTLSLEDFKKMKHKISKEERKIVYGKGHFSGYVNSSNARKMNAIMRNDGKLPSDYQEIADTLQDIINRNTLDYDIIVTRYVADDSLEAIAGAKLPRPSLRMRAEDYWKQVEAVPNQIEIGHVYTEKGFLSTSGVAEENVMTDKGVKLEIKVPKGTNCYITTNNKESEIIFGKNTKLKIVGSRIENIGTAKCKVVLECVME